MRCPAFILGVVLLLIVSPAFGVITNIAPFTGSFQENFDQFPTDTAVRSLNLFGNRASITVEGTSNSIKLEFSSQLGGDLVTPMSRLMMGQLGIANWVFNEPATRFGGYWESNSHADNATAQFFDAQGSLFDTRVVPIDDDLQQWQWNGWDFGDTPVSRIRVTGNGLISGFIWYENMELSVTPEPGCVGSIMTGFLIVTRRRRATV